MKKKKWLFKNFGGEGCRHGSNRLHRINYYLYSIWYSEPEGVFTS